MTNVKTPAPCLRQPVISGVLHLGVGGFGRAYVNNSRTMLPLWERCRAERHSLGAGIALQVLKQRMWGLLPLRNGEIRNRARVHHSETPIRRGMPS